MMSCDEVSMLSDELKPRRTPETSSFKDIYPRPSVPDLSIVETPSAEILNLAPRLSSNAVHNPQTNYASYNEWCQKTGFVNKTPSAGRYSVSQKPTEDNHHASRLCASAGAQNVGRTVLDRLSNSAANRPLSASAPPLGQGADFKRKPTCAPTGKSKVPDQAPVSLHPEAIRNPIQSKISMASHPAHNVVQASSSVSQQPADVQSNINHLHNHQRSVEQISHSRNHVQSAVLSQSSEGSQTTNANLGHVGHVSGVNIVNGSHYQPVHHSLGFTPRGNSPDQRNANLVHVGHGGGMNASHHQHVPVHHSSGFMPRGNSADSRLPFPYNPQGQGYNPLVGSVGQIRCTLACCQGQVQHTYPSPNAPSNYNPSHMCQGQYFSMPHDPYVDNAHKVSSKSKHHPARASYDDLYRIVLCQSNQLKTLQAQVEQLIISQREHKCLTDSAHKLKANPSKPPPSVDSLAVSRVTEEATQTSDFDPHSDNAQKMSIGVMTSFIHTVAYSGRVDLLDAMHNIPQHPCSERNSVETGGSQSSDDQSSSRSTSPYTSPKIPVNQKKHSLPKKCCKDCETVVQQDKRNGRLPKKIEGKRHEVAKNQIRKRKPREPVIQSTCSTGYKSNNPGVSAAITAVRGCQAALANRTHKGVDDSLTLDGADLPTVAEQPVSPMSSIHVDIQDYRETSSDDESNSSETEDEADYDRDQDASAEDNENSGGQRKGWTFYNNVLGQVNQILSDRETAHLRRDESTVPAKPSLTSLLASPGRKAPEVSAVKKVAFQGHNDPQTAQNLKDLALKYLQDNYPEELASNVQVAAAKSRGKEKVQDTPAQNVPASNMSFATFRYLERYNLLPENFNPQQYLDAATRMNGFPGAELGLGGAHHAPKDLLCNGQAKAQVPSAQTTSRGKPIYPHSHEHTHKHAANKRHPRPSSNGVVLSPQRPRHSPKKQAYVNSPTSKILDITTLRQQPKLL